MSLLHLRQGPIDLLCRAWGDPAEVAAACRQAEAAFAPVLTDLCAELLSLRAPPDAPPQGPVARAMYAACRPFDGLTLMAAVAGAVADHVLAAMCAGRVLSRAFVNNGGDIAFHITPGAELRCGLVSDLAAPSLAGFFRLRDHGGGLATSGRACKGRGGKSFSMGIADSVSVLARSAAAADAAATVIGNAVALPGHPAVIMRPAQSIDPGSDLGARLVTWDVGALRAAEVASALHAGHRCATELRAEGLIDAAVLALRGQIAQCGAGSVLELA